jgi:hypothetical protein
MKKFSAFLLVLLFISFTGLSTSFAQEVQKEKAPVKKVEATTKTKKVKTVKSEKKEKTKCDNCKDKSTCTKKEKKD